MTKEKIGRRKIGWNIPVRIILYLMIGIGASIMIFPFLWMITTSLKTTTQVFEWPPTFFPHPINWSGYIEIPRIWNVPRYFINTIVVSSAVTVVSLFFCSLAGYAFAHLQFPGKRLLFIYILASLMLPFHVRMIPTYILLRKLHWLNTYQGLIIPWWATAFGIFLMRQMMTPIPKALFDAARIDGCSEFRTYWQVALPSCIPGLIALGIFTFMGMWNEFLWPLVVVAEEEMKTLPLLVASMSGGEQQVTMMPWPTRMAGATLVVIPVIVIYIVFQRSFMKGLTLHAGIK